jgi:hypothetical protein
VFAWRIRFSNYHDTSPTFRAAVPISFILLVACTNESKTDTTKESAPATAPVVAAPTLPATAEFGGGADRLKNMPAFLQLAVGGLAEG